MPSAPNETAAEDVRNALQLLAGRDGEVDAEIIMDVADMAAIRTRLESALVKIADLEGLAIGRREQELGIMQDRADFETGQPLDYVRPGQHEVMLRGQEISEDGE